MIHSFMKGDLDHHFLDDPDLDDGRRYEAI